MICIKTKFVIFNQFFKKTLPNFGKLIWAKRDFWFTFSAPKKWPREGKKKEKGLDSWRKKSYLVFEELILFYLS